MAGVVTRVRRIVAALVAASTLVALSACTAPAEPAADYDQVEGEFSADLQERLDATLDEAIRLSGSSGGIAGVWAPWAGSWTSAAGTVDFSEGADKATTDTAFQVPGVTGELTCAMALRLVDADVIELDQRVDTMVRGLPGLGDITVEQLCRHTSGLDDYYPPLRRHFVANPERIWPAGELIASGMALPHVGEPGAVWKESRTGMLLLATALEQYTGRSWAELAEQYVLDPLNMDGTVLPEQSDTGYAGALGGYSAALAADGSPDCATVVDVSRRSSSIGGAAGGARSTLEEVREFSQAYASGALFEEATARQAWDVVPFGGSAPSWQAQGIGAQQYGPLRGVAGESTGALAAVFTDPDSGLTVVLALNNSTGGTTLVREGAFALASVASKAAPADERTQPLVELPWSYEQATQRMTEASPCAEPAASAE